MQDNSIKEVMHAKYLDLFWSKQLKIQQKITTMSNTTKIYKYPSHIKSNCYKALVKPNLGYAATV